MKIDDGSPSAEVRIEIKILRERGRDKILSILISTQVLEDTQHEHNIA